MDVIAFQNERITFICRIEASASIETAWDINGTHHPLLTSDATRQKWRYPNSTMNYTYGDYYFYLTARAEYNNSQILCRYTPFYSEWVFTCSDNATLTIQGILPVSHTGGGGGGIGVGSAGARGHMPPQLFVANTFALS